MANPQIEDGHVDIANEIMDRLAKTRIPGEARQVLDFILRKTYGWHKKEDAISLSQFEKGTGLKRPNVCSSIRRLIAMNIIYKGSSEKDTGSSQRDTSYIQVYGFQKDFEKWRVVPKKIPSPQIHTTPSMETHKRVVPNSIHTKETIQKKTIQKKETLPDIKIFLDFYHNEFQRAFNTTPIIEGAKDASITKSLLRIIPLDDLEGLLQKFFDSDDPFIQKSGYTLGVFKSQINKLKIGGQKHSGLKQWANEIMEEENETRR